jgi:hypothetical protein
MGETLDRLVPLLRDGAIAATALMGLTALVMVATGQPARRCGLARLALLGSIAILPIARFAPIPRLPLHHPVGWFAHPRPGAHAVDEPPMLDRSPGSIAIGRGLVVASTSATSLGLVTILLGWAGCARFLRKTIEPSAETLEIYEAIPSSARWRRPRLRVSARVRRPALIGTFRPTIVIPPDLDEPGQDAALRLSLLHEVAHAERLDPFFGLISALAGSLWFFVPPVWWVRRQMRLDQEFLADRGASTRFGPKASYASSLVGLAESGPGAAGDSGETSGNSADASPLFLRVLMLVRCPFPVEITAPRWWRVACLPMVAASTVLASGLTWGDRPFPYPPPGSCHPPRTEHGVLEVARLAIDARVANPNGRVSPYTLLHSLPPRFELVVDVYAEPSDLPLIAIAGRRLGPTTTSAGDPPLADGFHRVRMVRDDCGLRLWVSGREVPPQPNDSPVPEMLSLQPAPGLTGRFHNLVMAW